jgi:hypothetical protein
MRASAALIRSELRGARLIRTPVASKKALATAAGKSCGLRAIMNWSSCGRPRAGVYAAASSSAASSRTSSPVGNSRANGAPWPAHCAPYPNSDFALATA